MLFTGVRQIIAAFRGPPGSGDITVDRSVEFVRNLRQDGGLGFFGRTTASDAVSAAVRLLTEHGKKLSPEQTLKFSAQFKELAEAEAVRRRFIIQAMISGAVVGSSLSVLCGLVTVTADIQKAAIGLLGTVIGYWMR